MCRHGFAFIATHIDIEGEPSIELIPGYTFRRASEDEIVTIKNKIQEGLPLRYQNKSLPYEYVVKEEIYENQISYHFDKLDRDSWKYWVIAYKNVTSDRFSVLSKALALLPVDLDIAFDIQWIKLNDTKEEITMWSPIPLHIKELYSDNKFLSTNSKKINKEDIKKTGELYNLISEYDKSYNFIDHAISNYMNLRRLPKGSAILAVAYFSIIESLVTHPPRLTETLDSISHQLRNKIILLSRKFEHSINYNDRFGKIGMEKLWSKLYGYRSAIAHGTKVDFNNTKYSILKSNEDVSWFLMAIVKELIILSCRDPIFFSDLKKC